METFTTINISVEEGVATVLLNRPDRKIRTCVLSCSKVKGKHFVPGLI
jgi:hypothetical protein